MLIRQQTPDAPEGVETPVTSMDEVADKGHVDAVDNVDDEHGQKGRVVTSQIRCEFRELRHHETHSKGYLG